MTRPTTPRSLFLLLATLAAAIFLSESALADEEETGAAAAGEPYDVLFLISDDLTAGALSCYGNTVCETPNIDALAAEGTRFTRAYCQATYCGPSRASMLSGYYPHATGVFGYVSPRPQIGDRETWPEFYKNRGYDSKRVSKIFHMGVPGGVEAKAGVTDPRAYDGADDAQSWTARFNSPGPEWRAAGDGETLEGNPNGKRPVVGGNTFVVVEADAGDEAHSVGMTAAKAVELLKEPRDAPLWLGVGFVRPHVPFVAPRPYFEPFLPYENLALPERLENDWDDIPKPGINYKTSVNMKMDLRRQRKALGGYYASVAFMDVQVGKVMRALEESGRRDRTIVIFTSDHGYHLGEHDFWAKVSLHEESARVPLIVSVPGKAPAVCESFVELIDLFPTTLSLCGFEPPARLQGKDLSPLLDDPHAEVRERAFCVAPMRRGFLLRDDRFAFIQYDEDAGGGLELFDMHADPQQFHNLADRPAFAETVARYRGLLTDRLAEIRDNDLPD
ncbi:sulfatase [Alienimonas chondri]|uniref:Arylsulfatase n=1 Tax=Alienimonas chondri TaxID=2681879 RepID=A0ABX1VKI7_9PLAN|nr:sulfatase [Alienimonas chondri]NNJ27683.1 Arylsulfatase [Alienimonas chondri]